MSGSGSGNSAVIPHTQISKAAIKRGQAAVAGRANALKTLQIEYVPTDSIKPNSYNPNRQKEREFELLCRSMEEDGFTQPIVVQRSSREIVDGEHRWRAARHFKMAEVPVVFVDMTDEQMKLSTLSHNRARGSHDAEQQAAVLRDLRELGALDWAQDSLMINDDEMSRMLDDIPAPEALADEEYSEAWVPTRNVTPTGQLHEAENTTSSMTVAAEQKRKEVEVLLKNAKTHDDRLKIELAARKDSFRLLLIFKDDEADLVRTVLGSTPAAKILELCRARILAAAEKAG